MFTEIERYRSNLNIFTSRKITSLYYLKYSYMKPNLVANK